MAHRLGYRDPLSPGTVHSGMNQLQRDRWCSSRVCRWNEVPFLETSYSFISFFLFSSFLQGCHHDLQPSADGQEGSQLSFSCTAIHAAFVQASPDGGLSLNRRLIWSTPSSVWDDLRPPIVIQIYSTRSLFVNSSFSADELRQQQSPFLTLLHAAH